MTTISKTMPVGKEVRTNKPGNCSKLCSNRNTQKSLEIAPAAKVFAVELKSPAMALSYPVSKLFCDIQVMDLLYKGQTRK